MLRIIKIHPTVGKVVVCAVLVSEQNSENLHVKLNEYLQRNYGVYASIEYVESFTVPDVSFTRYNVEQFLNFDEMLENGLV